MARQRARLEMAIDLLDVIQKNPYLPQYRHIRRANTNFSESKGMVTKLVEVGFLIKPEKGSFSITQEGLNWLWKMKKLIAVYRGDKAQ